MFPYTLDNPAYGWCGLSSALRVRFRGGAVRAVSVAEVIAPTGADAAVRDLMAALARAGVTATCSAPGAPRYGDLSVADPQRYDEKDPGLQIGSSGYIGRRTRLKSSRA